MGNSIRQRIAARAPSLQHRTLPPDEAKLTNLKDALRDASGWLDSVANSWQLPSVKEAAARARAALQAVHAEFPWLGTTQFPRLRTICGALFEAPGGPTMLRFAAISTFQAIARGGSACRRYSQRSTLIRLPSSVQTKELMLWGYAA